VAFFPSSYQLTEGNTAGTTVLKNLVVAGHIIGMVYNIQLDPRGQSEEEITRTLKQDSDIIFQYSGKCKLELHMVLTFIDMILFLYS
jgi:hypothetical protein